MASTGPMAPTRYSVWTTFTRSAPESFLFEFLTHACIPPRGGFQPPPQVPATRVAGKPTSPSLRQEPQGPAATVGDPCRRSSTEDDTSRREACIAHTALKRARYQPPSRTSGEAASGRYRPLPPHEGREPEPAQARSRSRGAAEPCVLGIVLGLFLAPPGDSPV
jgi:hypothetical protein